MHRIIIDIDHKHNKPILEEINGEIHAVLKNMALEITNIYKQKDVVQIKTKAVSR